MASVNIPSYHDDPNYRYKMPRVRAKVEGRGNGVKTNIMNMGDIARALKRAPEYPTKFCGCELGASSKFDLAEGKAIVNGIHSENDVQLVIDKFIERFVLCPKCKLPEIDLLVESGRVVGRCNACGRRGDMDNAHKVATFIVKNPPATALSTMGKTSSKSSSGKDLEKSKESKEERRLRKKEKDPKEGQTNNKDKDSSKDNKDAKDSKTSSGKKLKDKKRKHHHRHREHTHTTLTYSAPEVDGVIERLGAFMSHGEKPTPKEFFQEVRLLQVAQDFGSNIRVFVALATVVGSEVSVESFKANAPYLLAVCDKSVDGTAVLEALEKFVFRFGAHGDLVAEEARQVKRRVSIGETDGSADLPPADGGEGDPTATDGAAKHTGGATGASAAAADVTTTTTAKESLPLEEVPPPVVEDMPPATAEEAEVYSRFGLILHTLYNCDILEEDSILERYGGGSDTDGIGRPEYLARNAAEAFVQWLKETDSASEEEGNPDQNESETDDDENDNELNSAEAVPQ